MPRSHSGEILFLLYPHTTSAVDGDRWSTRHPGRFTPGKKPVTIAQQTGWTSGPVWTGTDNLTPTMFGTPYRSNRSKSLYQLNCRGRKCLGTTSLKAQRIIPIFDAV